MATSTKPFSFWQLGQKVKILTDCGSFSNSGTYNRQGQIGEIVDTDHRDKSLQVKFETGQGEFGCCMKWFEADEIQPVITTNAERKQEIQNLESQVETLRDSIAQLHQDILDNPEKIKAEAGDTVKFTYRALGECLMFIMTKEQANFFDPGTEGYGDFVFLGSDCQNSVDMVKTGTHLKLELKKKGTYKWIDSKEVDWSGILPK